MKKAIDKFRRYAIIQKLSEQRTEYGGIAQLGERLNGIQEVSGSIPLISTKSREIYSISRFFLYFFAQKVVVVMFKTHSSLPFRPLVFHLKIKYSRGGISWLVSQ